MVAVVGAVLGRLPRSIEGVWLLGGFGVIVFIAAAVLVDEPVASWLCQRSLAPA